MDAITTSSPISGVHTIDLGNDVVGVEIVLLVSAGHLHRQRHGHLLLAKPRKPIFHAWPGVIFSNEVRLGTLCR